MGMGFAPTWLRQVSPLLYKTTITTELGVAWSPRIATPLRNSAGASTLASNAPKCSSSSSSSSSN